MISDIFENSILCKKCETKMNKVKFRKNGFVFRAMICPNCGEKIIHPLDEQEYNKFVNLKNKEFEVKMRLVGNSYAVSIPKEIVSFMREQEKMMDEMVKLCFEDFGKLSLNFNIPNENTRIIKAKEYKLIKNNKPVVYTKEFYDSANPENKKSFIIKKSKKKNE